ncbi:AAA family ATPase [Komagataeibacter xylinus]|uniref:ATP-dependent nuclease n=1 Tax=Komagataeibacter xylinus TaxID=28448 RepID=UPI00280A65AF|nr:AAA family ATPase [Komagataeibacter xylinus]
MSASQQVIHYLKIDHLKGIRNLQEIRFDEKNLTSIVGVNGSGKSTILHALACCYKPEDEKTQRNWKFSDFFTPTTHSTWKGSEFTMVHSYREGEQEIKHEETTYRKMTDRWSPKYIRRPERFVDFIGIKTCVPRIEEERAAGTIKFSTTKHKDSDLIISEMSSIFNKNYDELSIHVTANKKMVLGLSLKSIKYSSLAMGAGEQRVIQILSSVFTAPKYGLILIDEIDLLLHTDALKRLLRSISGRASSKNLQVIFTSHRETILTETDIVSIKHLQTIEIKDSSVAVGDATNAIKAKTLCFSNTTPDILYRLTGDMARTFEVFVEDDVAKSIIDWEASKLKIKRHVNTVFYGSASNCFSVVGGLALTKKYDPEKQLYVLDGDVLSKEDERKTQLEKVVSGTEEGREQFREKCVNGIRQFNPSSDFGLSPESQIHHMIRSLNPDDLSGNDREIYDISSNIEYEKDKHYLIGKIIDTLNVERSVGLSQIIDLAAKSSYWDTYTQQVRDWLNHAATIVSQPAA